MSVKQMIFEWYKDLMVPGGGDRQTRCFAGETAANMTSANWLVRSDEPKNVQAVGYKSIRLIRTVFPYRYQIMVSAY